MELCLLYEDANNPFFKGYLPNMNPGSSLIADVTSRKQRDPEKLSTLQLCSTLGRATRGATRGPVRLGKVELQAHHLAHH